MTQDVAIINKPNSFLPQSFEQAERYAERIANSSLCPKDFKGKPGDVFIAMQMGAEVGLSPMQAIQNIAVINGRPCLWGDGLLAVVRAHPHCLSIRQWIEGEGDNRIAYCAIKRKGQGEEIRSFSVAQAKKAQLWNKAGTWTSYPERMLSWRATGFCARDVFADALRGLQSAEEVQDYIEAKIMPEAEVRELREVQKKIESGTPVSLTYTVDKDELAIHLDKINTAPDLDILKIAYKDGKTFCDSDKESSNEISKAVRERKSYLESIKNKSMQPEDKSKVEITSIAPNGVETTSEWMNQYTGESPEVKHG